jgi:hypothetical protein
MDENVRLVNRGAISPDDFYAQKPLEHFLGRHVKVAFQSADCQVEHMWVLVTHIDGDSLVGTLDSEPVSVTHVGHGDRVVLSRVQIEAVYLSFDEWCAEVEELRAKGDYFNRWLGPPVIGDGLEQLYLDDWSPRQALVRWRDWIPEDDQVEQGRTE